MYRVKAVNAHGASHWSDYRRADTPAAPTPPPTPTPTPTPTPKPTPLTASFEDEAETHNGADSFTFRIEFSEAISISYKTLRDHSLDVTDGSVTRARRVNGSSSLWEITVEPDSGADVTITLPVTTDCGDQGAVCTSDGRMLSNEVKLTVTGPDAPEPTPTPQPNTPATGAPTISGMAQVGETLAADTSGIYDADGLDDAVFSYQWIRNDESADADIASATDPTYTLVEADKDKTMKVRVSFTDDGSNPESLTSAATASVDPAADETDPPGPIWSAILTVDRVGENYGYQSFLNPQAGSLIPDSFVLDGVTYTVGSIQTKADYFTVFGVDRKLPVGFTLELDGAQFESSDASLESHTYGHVYTWLGRGMDWNVGEEVTALVAASPTLTLVVLVDPDLAPSNLKARGSGEKVTLTWDDPAKDAGSVTGYQILRGQGDGELETLVADTQSTGTDYTDSDVSRNLTEYRYQVKALRSGEASQGSNVAEVLVALAAQGDATGAPAITGTAQVGEALTANLSNVSDPDGIDDATFSYQWIADDGTTDSDISGATGETYRPLLAHLGQTIKVRVSFTDDNDNAESLTSGATAAVTASPYGAVIWAAKMTVGLYLPSSGSRYEGFAELFPTSFGSIEPSEFSYDGADHPVSHLFHLVDSTDDSVRFGLDSGLGSGQFNLYLDGQPFLITEAGEHGTHIDFQFFNHGLTWTDGQEVEVRLAVNRPATGVPTITGTAHVGMTLTADTSAIDDPDGITGATFTYQWVRSDGTDTDISGATDSTYTLVAADVGKTIKVNVSFTDNAKFPESLTSEATAEVEVHTTEIWSATLTVKAEPSGHGNNWGWNSKGDYPGSGLTSTSFPYFGQPREILEIRNHRGLTRLRFRISTSIPSGGLNKLTLHIGDDIALDFTDATNVSNDAGGSSEWTDADEFSAGNTPFTDGAMLSLSITRTTEAPGMTRLLKATPKEDGMQIDLSWTAPQDNGGTEITGYRIEVSADGGMNWTDHIADTQSTSTMYSHTGLVESDTRHYRVSAITSFNTGPASNVASATTDATPPNFDRGSCSHNTCTLFFDEALDTGSGRTAPLSAFAVTAGSSPIMVSGLEFQNSSEIVLTGLVPAIRQGQAVEVTYNDPSNGDDEAALQDVAGNDVASFTETVTNESTLMPVVPDAPTALVAEPDGTTRIDLSWTAPEDNGGVEITGYRIEVSADGGMNWTDLVADTASTATMYSHTSGLSSGDRRHYRVSAINSIGPGNPSRVAHAITGPRVASVTISNIQLTSADAKVEVANLKNTQQTVYLQYREKDSPNWGSSLTKNTTGNTVTLTLAPLTEKTGYDVRASLDNSFPPGFKTETAGFFSDSTENKVWSATMTVGTSTDCPDVLGWSSSSFRTCQDSGATNFEGDALTRPGFVYDNERYQFHSVEFNTDRKELSVLFGNKKESSFMADDALRAAMTLQVGGMEFPLVDAIYPGHAIYQVIAPELYSMVWENVAFSWTGGETVNLQMRMPPPAGAPLNLTYTAAILPTGGGTVTLDWDEPLSGPPEGGYRIEVLGRFHRYAVGSFQVSGDITTFTDGSGRAIHGEYTTDGLPATSGQYLGPIRLGSGQRYYYQVLALNANGKSPPSNVVEVTDATTDPVASAPPGTPTGLTAEKYSGNPDRYVWRGQVAIRQRQLRGTGPVYAPTPHYPGGIQAAPVQQDQYHCPLGPDR